MADATDQPDPTSQGANARAANSADADPPGNDAQSAQPQTVGGIAELYLGNLLYALERCAMSLDTDEKPLDAAFYRAIGRKLAVAHGRSRDTEK